MSSRMTGKVRLVRCPNCRLILPEIPNIPVYHCGGCFTTLQAKSQRPAVPSLPETPVEENNNLDHVSEDTASSSSSHETPLQCLEITGSEQNARMGRLHRHKHRSKQTHRMQPCPSAPAIFKKKHEVFISFRGPDVRAGFLSHLSKDLRQHTVDVFVDKNLKRGKNISESLLEIIEGSYISVVILSKQYTDSVYCMEELAKILECKERNGQRVIPVFYGMDPDHVEEVACTFEDAIAQGRLVFQGMAERWCQSLREIAAVAGFVSSAFESDSDLVDEVTQGVLEELNDLLSSDSCSDDGFVGIDSRIKNVMALLDQQDVHIVGICGIGGIGKTTIALAIFHQIRNEFESSCFVEKVREKSERDIDILWTEMLPELIGVENHKTGNSVMMPSSLIRQKLSMKKFLLVLDDVSDFNQVKFIIGNGVSYGPGSKIIVTSRDRRLLNYMDSVIYEVETLDPDESLRLFCVHAFKQKTPPEEYGELSMRAIAYAQGLPSVLGGLGFRLYQRSVDEWEAELGELERLKDMSSGKTRRILTNKKDSAKFTGSYLYVLLASLLWKVKIMLNFRKQAA